VSCSPSRRLAGIGDIAYSTLRELRGSSAQSARNVLRNAVVGQGSWNANSGKCGSLANARRFAKQHTSERERGSTALTRERVGAVLVFHGVLAPHASWRSAVIPGRSEAESPPAAVGSPRERASRWAALLRRVFAIDVVQSRHGSAASRLEAQRRGDRHLAPLLTRDPSKGRRREAGSGPGPQYLPPSFR
jgi:hypothetical protein